MIPIFESQAIGRSCGSCTKCCEGWLFGDSYGFEFKPGVPCKFLRKSGCSIYPIRPENPCKTFRCHWKDNTAIPDWMRPDQSGIILLPKRIGDFFYLQIVFTDVTPPDRVYEWSEQQAQAGRNLVAHMDNGYRIFSGNDRFKELISEKYA